MLEKLKAQVVRVAKEADKSGLCKHKSGNFSIRDRETGYIVISPSGVAREFLTTKNIIVVDIEGHIIEIESDVKPSSEMKVHLTAYKNRKDISSVIHTHSHYATAFAVQGMEIKPIIFEAVAYGVRTPVAKYQQPGTQKLGDSIIEPLELSDVCLLEKHGVVTVGKNIDDAFLKALYVEDVARIVYHAMQIGGGKLPDAIPQEDFDAVSNP